MVNCLETPRDESQVFVLSGGGGMVWDVVVMGNRT